MLEPAKTKNQTMTPATHEGTPWGVRQIARLNYM